ncbi:hypothetical protein GCM10027091_64710 [Streptomyces daliensis]
MVAMPSGESGRCTGGRSVLRAWVSVDVYATRFYGLTDRSTYVRYFVHASNGDRRNEGETRTAVNEDRSNPARCRLARQPAVPGGTAPTGHGQG